MQQIVCWSLMLGCLLGLAGCGEALPEMYTVQGLVRFDGQPVPAGEVVFEPNPTAGNHGHQTRAEIVDGRYATLSNRGAVPGEVVIRVYAYDGQPRADAPRGSPLAKVYETQATLPKADSTQDFEIPKLLGLKLQPIPSGGT